MSDKERIVELEREVKLLRDNPYTIIFKDVAIELVAASAIVMEKLEKEGIKCSVHVENWITLTIGFTQFEYSKRPDIENVGSMGFKSILVVFSALSELARISSYGPDLKNTNMTRIAIKGGMGSSRNRKIKEFSSVSLDDPNYADKVYDECMRAAYQCVEDEKARKLRGSISHDTDKYGNDYQCQ